MPTPTIIIVASESCPDCGGIRLQPYANSRRQSLCLACGCSFDASHMPTADVFDDLLGQANALPEVEFGAVREELFAGRGW